MSTLYNISEDIYKNMMEKAKIIDEQLFLLQIKRQAQ